MLGMLGYTALALDEWLNYWIIILTKDGEGRDDDTEKGVSADVVRHKLFWVSVSSTSISAYT